MDYLDTLGTMALTLRLRRLNQRMEEDGRRFYQHMNATLEPNWYAILLLLRDHPDLSITEIATALRVKHPTIVKTVQALTTAGFLSTTTDPKDKRRKQITLTAHAMETIEDFQPIWQAFEDALTQMMASTTGDMLHAIRMMEDQLDAETLDARVQRLLQATARKKPQKHKTPPHIRRMRHDDLDAIEKIGRSLAVAGDTYAFEPDISAQALHAYWHPPEPSQGWVATYDDEVVGMYVVRPNRPGPGAHVCNASFAVSAAHRGLGIGRHLAEHALAQAVKIGYDAMQFNAVVATNHRAIALWLDLGFRIIGTIPDAFTLPSNKRVALHIMHKHLERQP